MARLKLSENLRPLSEVRTSKAVQQAVDDAERDLAEGHWVENSEILARLKRWSIHNLSSAQ